MLNADRVYLRSMLPSLGSDPRSIVKMVEMRIAIERRLQQVSQKVLKHRSSGGKIDDKFFADLQQWADENPLLQKERTTKAVDVPTDPDTAPYFVK